MICRVLPHEIDSGQANMALDEALLDAVDADPSSAVLRTYQWSPTTLSLGYFQRIGDARAEPRWRDVPIVRRPSGGGAIWHDVEVTYALVVPRRESFAGKAADLYRTIHDAIRIGLTDRGFRAERRGRDVPAHEHRPFVCFLDHDPEDLVIGDVKVVGSSQRRRPRAVLQHGSLLLGPSDRAPELPGIGLRNPDPLEWASWLRKTVVGGLRFQAQAAAIRSNERTCARKLEREVYGTDAWKMRR